MVSNQRGVVITGMGIVSPLGCDLASLRGALREGRSGIGPLTMLPAGDIGISYGGESTGFTGQIGDFGELSADQKKQLRKSLKVMSREIQYAVASAQHALSHAGLRVGDIDPQRAGTCYGSDYITTVPDEFVMPLQACSNTNGRVDFAEWTAKAMPRVNPLWLLKYLPNMPASHIAITNDLRGPSNSLTDREASFNASIDCAARIISTGRAEMMLVGATGTRLHPVRTLQTLCQEEVASSSLDPTEASRPFDRARTGMVLGEGAGTVILEDEQSALKRGATIHGRVIGTSVTCSRGRNRVANRRQSLAAAIRCVLTRSRVEPQMVGHVHAHGLGTCSCDIEEAMAIGDALEAYAKKVPVVALKSYTGNLGAGSGAVEFIASLLAMRDGRLFPTLNYATPDARCPLAVTADRDRPSGGSFLNLSVTPQGQASVVLTALG